MLTKASLGPLAKVGTDLAHFLATPTVRNTNRIQDILNDAYDVACAFPGWMDDMFWAVQSLMRDVFPGRVTVIAAPAACLNYYFAKTKNAVVKAGDVFLHCGVDEKFTTLSDSSVDITKDGIFNLVFPASVMVASGTLGIQTAFQDELEKVLADYLDQELQEPAQVVELLNGVRYFILIPTLNLC
jgi:hypothetical protein